MNRTEYSTPSRALCGPVAASSQLNNYAPSAGVFDHSYLLQTDIDSIPAAKPNGMKYNVKNLKDVVTSVADAVGRVWLDQGCIGTCTLIAPNLVLTARHVLQEHDLAWLLFYFNDSKDKRTLWGRFSCIVEDNSDLDFVIIGLQKDLLIKPIEMDFSSAASSPPALLHYPLGKSLQVSVRTFEQSPYQQLRMVAFHDSDYGSSGGPYITPSGKVIAIHLGSEYEPSDYNLRRYAVYLQKISQKSRIIARLYQNSALRFIPCPYFTNVRRLKYVANEYVIDKEGTRSERVLRDKLKGKFSEIPSEKKISKGKKLSTKEENLNYLKTSYPEIFKAAVQFCFGHAGSHKYTRTYSLSGAVESDHTIPYRVWAATTNSLMRAVVEKGKTTEDRPGELFMPAITIPYEPHRALRTTGSGADRERFCNELIQDCNANKVHKALYKCLCEYRDKGKLKLGEYKKAIDIYCEELRKLYLVDRRQIKQVKNNLGL